jgi:ABC-type glycerol-3-phosphate transport system substrate-binding protein
MNKYMIIRSLSLLLVCFCTMAWAVPFTKDKITVLISMVGPQKEYFEKVLIQSFAMVYNIDVDVINAENIDNIEQQLDADKKNIGLFMVPFGKCWSLVNKNKVMPLNSFISKKDLESIPKEYILTWLGQQNGLTYFLPQKYETRIMTYCKSKVADAVDKWNMLPESGGSLRDSIGLKMKEINGFGLPTGYTLESDPNMWDYYDIFVIGMLWSKTAYNGECKPRIAHRSKRYSGTSLRLIDRAFQCQGDSAAIVRMNGDAVCDAFEWESAYAWAGILNKRMWDEGWNGQDLWKAFGSNDAFLSFMTQVDCFFLHGTDDPDMKGFLPDPSDMGVSLMPEGCSVSLDASGYMVRTGTKAITNGGWWWAIPAEWSAPDLSYKLFQYLTSRQNQLDECTRFGQIPVREDILKDKSILFGSGWMSLVFRTSYQQVQKNNNTIVPDQPRFDEIANLYLDAWYDIVVGRNWAADKGVPKRDYIIKILQEKYSRKAQEIILK